MGQHTLNKVARFFQHGPRYWKGGGTFKNVQFAGITTVPSGSASKTVSTSVIQSDSVVMYGTNPTSVGVAMNSGGSIVVNSKVQGVSFAFAWATGSAVPFDVNVMWEIVKRSP